MTSRFLVYAFLVAFAGTFISGLACPDDRGLIRLYIAVAAYLWWFWWDYDGEMQEE